MASEVKNTTAIFKRLESGLVTAIKSSEGERFSAMNALRARITRRIFLNGINANGGKIGSYSTRPMLVGAKSFTALEGQVKSSKAVSKLFRTKQARRAQKWVTTKDKKRLVQLQGGYREFRELVGRKSDFVNLDLTGSLRGSISTGIRGNRMVIAIGSSQVQKATYLEEKYGEVFSATDEEVAAFEKQVTRAVQNAFEKTLNAI